MSKNLKICAIVVFLAFFTGACSAVSVSKEDLLAKKQEEAVKTLGEQSAIFWAAVRNRANQTANAVAEQYNLRCEEGLQNTARCYQFMARLTSEPELQKALETAKILGVYIQASSQFAYGDGWVKLDTDSSTEAILNYLLGKKENAK